MSTADHEPSTPDSPSQAPGLSFVEAATLPVHEQSPVRSRSLTMPDDVSEDGFADESSPSPRSAPQRLGRYLVLGTLGSGGMGTVLEAFDRTLDRRVAVKILHRELGHRYTHRLLREAQAMAKLSHPNVVQVYEAGEVDDQLFIAMELVRGQTLADWISADPRPGWRRSVEVFLQVGAGLAAAHAQGLVHRDFKPGNAIVDLDGRARVLDFGLARQADGAKASGDEDDEPTRPAEALDDDEQSLPSLRELELAALDTPLTRTGAVLGTPAYMPPEQMKGREADARSDQFSFCVSLYEALYGERPFEGTSLMTLMVSMTSGHVRPPPKGTDVPAKLRQVVLRGLALEPEARWPSMDALLAELRRLMVPPARRLLAVGLAGGLAATGLGLAVWAEVGLRCDGAAAQLEGIWDEARKQEVRDAILATGLPYASDTLARVEARLDAYGDAWVAEHTEVCEATRVHEEQSTEVMDLRMACLGRHRTELRAAVGVLAQVDAAWLGKAVNLVEGLPALSECDDVEALVATQLELPPPEDPVVAEQVEAERARLAECTARRDVGDYVRSEALAHAVVEQAEVLGYGPLHAEALVRRGSARSKLGRHAEAEADFEAAFVLALRHEHDRMQLDATSELTYVVGYQLRRHDEGLRWSAMAEALAHRRGCSDDVKAQVWGTKAAVLIEAQRSGEAEELYRRALAIQEVAHGPRHPKVAVTSANLASSLIGQGKLEEATEQLRRVLDVSEEVFGPRHPALASVLGNLGIVLAMQGKLVEAREHLERYVVLQQTLLGPDHPDVGTALGNLGLMLLEQGRGEQGKARQATLALSHERLAASLALFERAKGPRSLEAGDMSARVGHVLMEQGKLDEARTSYERALSIRMEVQGPEHPAVAGELVSLAKIALEQHDEATARGHAERAVAICEAGEPMPHELAGARFLLARVLWEDPEQHERARTLVEQARAGLDGGGPHAELLAAEITAWLAEHPAP